MAFCTLYYKDYTILLIYLYSNLSAEKYLSNKIVEKLIEENSRRKYPLFACNQVDALFAPKMLDKEFRLVATQDSKRVHYKEGIKIYKGHINHPELGHIACYLKEVRSRYKPRVYCCIYLL